MGRKGKGVEWLAVVAEGDESEHSRAVDWAGAERSGGFDEATSTGPIRIVVVAGSSAG